MEGFGRVVVGSAAIASVVIGSAVGGLLGAAAFFAVDGLTPEGAEADPYRGPTSALVAGLHSFTSN
ncbi:MAG: hypothetical protein CL859_00540 [Cyanobium sp. ARS6]|uniref:hypothetical protein n=1 Tax=unclassified Synechococcus TaxID=2626047 RepID=UPI000C3F969E|nr:hypothetical protein [Cyanobium sp. ARS6]